MRKITQDIIVNKKASEILDAFSRNICDPENAINEKLIANKKIIKELLNHYVNQRKSMAELTTKSSRNFILELRTVGKKESYKDFIKN